MMADLVCQHDAHLGVRERAVEHRAPEHDAARRTEADRVRIRLARRAAHVLDADGDAGDALLVLELPGRAPQCRVLQGLRRRQIGLGEREAGSDRDEHERPGDPPDLAEPPRQEHHDEERDAERDERAAELEPVAERPLEIARFRQVVPSCPPDVEQRERQLDQPDEPEPEHAQQHPGADRPRGRLPGEPRPATGIDPQRREQRDLPEDPGEEEEPLDVHRPADESLAEHGVGIDAGEVQAGRDRRAEEERGAHEPDGHRGSRNDDADRAVQAGSIPDRAGPAGSSIGSTSCSSRSRSRTAGAEYG